MGIHVGYIAYLDVESYERRTKTADLLRKYGGKTAAELKAEGNKQGFEGLLNIRIRVVQKHSGDALNAG